MSVKRSPLIDITIYTRINRPRVTCKSNERDGVTLKLRELFNQTVNMQC